MPGQATRSSSIMQESHTDWERTLPACSPPSTCPSLPYLHYSLIYVDNDGRVKVADSQSIRTQDTSIFTSDNCKKFMQAVGCEYIQGGDFTYNLQGRHPTVLTPRICEPAPQISSHLKKNGTVVFRIGDTGKVLEYYKTALRHFQQINCRLIAKVFIQIIEPGKRTKHPYNGGKKRDPNQTKPNWWPANVEHREPDHLRTNDRLRLLIHLLRKSGKKKTLDDLKEAVQGLQQQLRPVESKDKKMQILLEIFRIRQMEEQFKRSEIDGNTEVHVLT
ncbi:hypothetical protein BDV19DRAFT_48936 [Aspergillus venezuelensis]